METKKTCKEKCLSILRLIPTITLLILSLITITLSVIYAQSALAILGVLGIICAIIIFYQVFTSSSFQVVSALKKSIAYLNKTNKALEISNLEFQKKISLLESQISSLNLITQKFNSLRSLFSEDNKEFKKNIYLLKEQIDSLSSISQDSQELKELISQSKSLLEELLSWGSSESREEMKALRLEILSSIKSLKQKKEDLKQENEKIKHCIHQNEKLLIQVTTQIDCFKTQVIQLTSLLNQLTLSLEKLNDSNLELLSTKEDLKNISLSLQKELDKLINK